MIDELNYTLSYSNPNSKEPGIYKVTVKFKGLYSGSRTLCYTITRGKNNISGVMSTQNIEYSKLSQANQKFDIKVVLKEKATMNFLMYSVPLKAKNYITVNAKGNVTVKKGLAKGTYPIKVRITSVMTKHYKASSVSKTINIVVK